jgi:hypothetical protein
VNRNARSVRCTHNFQLIFSFSPRRKVGYRRVDPGLGKDVHFISREIKMDPLEELKKIAGETGTVSSVYGGFKVRVLKPRQFPWYKLIGELIKMGQRVWVEKKEGKIHITSEPRIQ